MNTFVSKSSGIVNKSRQVIEPNKFLNSFSNKKVDAPFSMNAIHFPELGSSSVKTVLAQESSNYMDAIQMQNNEVDCTLDKVPEGCICYTLEKNKITETSGDDRLSYSNSQSTEYGMNDVIDILSSRWERYKEKYIELYGEDVYEKMYMIPVTDDVWDNESIEDIHSDYSDNEEYNETY